MIIFLCEPSYEGILSGIYDAGISKIPKNELRLELKNENRNLELFAHYRECESSETKAAKVRKTIREKLSAKVQQQVYLASLSQDPMRADKLYHYLKVLFTLGAEAVERLQIPEISAVFELCRNVSNEQHQMIEFLRFSQIGNGSLLAKIGPKNDVLELISPHFADRLPEENWLILDEGRRKASVHRKGRTFFLTDVPETLEETLNQQMSYGSLPDMHSRQAAGEEAYETLWKTFFETVAIRERTNPDCQQTHLPLRFRPYMTEFVSG